MKRTTPSRRTQRLLFDKLSDEVLVYDLDPRKVHCLNRNWQPRLATLQWKKTAPEEIAQRICVIQTAGPARSV